MNKREFIEFMAGMNNTTKTNASKAVDMVFETIIELVASGEPVKVTGFGQFEIKHRPARNGRNPSTGETINISPRSTPVFRPAVQFKRRVDETNG